MTETRRVYSEEFNRDAVRLAQERGNLRATAVDLGISETFDFIVPESLLACISR